MQLVDARITAQNIQDVPGYEEATGEQRTRTWDEPNDDVCDTIENPKT